MVDSVFMAELSWPEFQTRIAANPPVFLPVGATEQHGPHLPPNVDVILSTGGCERVAGETVGLVAPTIPYGYKSQPRSGGGQPFPGTASLDAQTLAVVLRPDLVRMDRVPSDGPARFHTYDRWPVPKDFVPASGVLAVARGSSAEKGSWLMHDHVRLIAAAVRREFALAGGVPA